MMLHENIVECRRLLQHDGWTTNVLWAVFKRQRVQVINGGRVFSSVVFFFAAGVLINADGFQTKKFPYVHAVNERKMDAFIQLGSVGSENECPKGRGS